MFSMTLHKQPMATARKLMQTLPERSMSFRQNLMYAYAQFAMIAIRKRILGGFANRAYKKSFEVVEVTGAPSRAAVYAIRLNPKVRTLRKKDSETTVLYVKPVSTMMRVKPEVQVLMDYGPWPVDMLPFTPDARQAIIVSRKVSKGEVTAVRGQREGDRSEWQQAMTKAGRRMKKPLVKIPPKIRALPDVVFQALRLEYGLGGERSKPHWRPGIRTIVSLGLRAMIKKRRLGRYFNPFFTGWNKVPEARKSISFTDIKPYESFQKRLGIKAGERK